MLPPYWWGSGELWECDTFRYQQADHQSQRAVPEIHVCLFFCLPSLFTLKQHAHITRHPTSARLVQPRTFLKTPSPAKRVCISYVDQGCPPKLYLLEGKKWSLESSDILTTSQDSWLRSKGWGSPHNLVFSSMPFTVASMQFFFSATLSSVLVKAARSVASVFVTAVLPTVWPSNSHMLFASFSSSAQRGRRAKQKKTVSPTLGFRRPQSFKCDAIHALPSTSWPPPS